MSFKHPQIKKYKLLADGTWLSAGDKERGLQKGENSRENLLWFPPFDPPKQK